MNSLQLWDLTEGNFYTWHEMTWGMLGIIAFTTAPEPSNMSYNSLTCKRWKVDTHYPTK